MNWLKKHRTKVLLCGIFLLLTAVCLLVYGKMKTTLRESDVTDRWAGDSETRFGYFSVFYPETGKGDESLVYGFESTLEKSLTEASLETPPDGSLWKDAYCGTAMATVSTDRGSATVKALGVGGDFFFFHPLLLRSGNYLSPRDLMHDRVVLDKELAWTLFGATDVAGMELSVNGKPFLVAGVVERETDFASKAAAEENAGLYLFYDALGSPGIVSYEVVLPDPVTNFAKNLVTESFPEKTIVDVKNRYSVGSLFSVLTSFGKRSMRTDNIIFPTWENAARLTEDYAALSLLLALLFFLTPLGFGVVLAVQKGRKGFMKGVAFAKEKSRLLYEKANDKLYEREQRRKALPPSEEDQNE